jgi:hypothetical protein
MVPSIVEPSPFENELDQSYAKWRDPKGGLFRLVEGSLNNSQQPEFSKKITYLGNGLKKRVDDPPGQGYQRAAVRLG